jgi:iron complex transport system substrate-binding protein
LFALCPEKLVGLASEFGGDQQAYLDPEYTDLPILGNFYSGTLNLEQVMTQDPQVVVDIGDRKPANSADLDGITTRTGLPTVFIQMTFASMADSLDRLGDLLGADEQADALTGFIGDHLDPILNELAGLDDDQRPSVYYGQGDGLTAVVAGSSHDAVIQAAGGRNVAVVDRDGKAGTAAVSLEQLLIWQPDYLLLTPATLVDEVTASSGWSGLDAVTADRALAVPVGPYSWLDSPPSINQILGVIWLSQVLHPDRVNNDLADLTTEFYRLFYHYELTATQTAALLAATPGW